MSMRSSNKLVTFIKVLMPSLMFLFLSIYYFPSKNTGVRRNLAGLYCCDLPFQDNTGHKLTENVLDLHRCKPAVSFGSVPHPAASNTHLTQIANVLGTSILERNQCFDAHSRLPTSTEQRMTAYSLFSALPEWSYDAIEVRDILRDVQKKLLTSCNMVPPSYAEINIASLNYNNNRYMHQQPSTSVNILRRGADRVLLNAQEVLDACKGLRLHCQIIELDDLFQQPESKDICHVLKKFAHAVNIGVQGAEMIYPHYTSSRMILVHNRRMKWNDTKPINRFRFGEKLFSGERKVGTHFISTDPQILDWFYLEFGAHFGNYLNAIAGDVDVDSLEHIKGFNKKQQCQAHPKYCANLNADISQLKTELEALIDKGYLLTIEKQNWWIQMCKTRKICLHDSSLRGIATLSSVNDLD